MVTVERSRVGWGFWLWWVLASTVGWAVSVALLVAPPLAVNLVGGGVGLGAITGIVLVWLLRQPAPEA